MSICSETGVAIANYSVGNARPFLVGIDEQHGGAHITVHAGRTVMSRRQARDLRRKLETEAAFARCRVRRHGTFGLDQAQSLESFLTPFKHDQILFDPSGAFERSRELVGFAHAVRRKMGSNIKSLLWQGRHGVIYVVLDQERLFQDRKARRADLIAIERFLGKTLRESCGPMTTQAVNSVRISFSAPDVPATPIDRRSAHCERGFAARIKASAVVTSLAALMGIGAVGMANAG